MLPVARPSLTLDTALWHANGASAVSSLAAANITKPQRVAAVVLVVLVVVCCCHFSCCYCCPLVFRTVATAAVNYG